MAIAIYSIVTLNIWLTRKKEDTFVGVSLDNKSLVRSLRLGKEKGRAFFERNATTLATSFLYKRMFNLHLEFGVIFTADSFSLINHIASE